jgi:hypothetical protein
MRVRALVSPITASALSAVLLAALPMAAAHAADLDGDGLRDGFERRYGLTSHDTRDSDGDGVVDSAEDEDGDKLGNRGEQRYGTDPGDPDTDGDGILDGDEDEDGDGRTNAREQLERRVPRNVRPALARAHLDNNGLKRWCGVTAGHSRVKACRFGDPDSDTTVVLMGDSHALALLLPFKRAVNQKGWQLVSVIKGGCIPLVGLGNANQYRLDRIGACRQWRARAFAWLRAQRDPPDLVVLAFSDRYRLADRSGAKLPKDHFPELWAAGLRRTLKAMPKRSQLLVLGDVPHNRGNPIRCLRRDPSDMSACATPRKPLEERPVELALRAEAAVSGARFDTLYDSICPHDPCPLVQGDVLIWRDRSHLTSTFAMALAPAVRRILEEALAE